VRVDRTAFYSLTRSGAFILAAGERGVLARSGDEGQSWHTSRLPTQRNFTTILGDPRGLAVSAGHGGVVMRSEDAGASWQALNAESMSEANPDREPMLCGLIDRQGDVWLGGAFGTLIRSRDRGLTWRRSDPVAADFDRHIYGIFESVDGRERWLVGESGSVFRAGADAERWVPIDAPYQGSFFGGLFTASGAVLVFGMRGAIYRLDPQSMTWTTCASPQPVAWMSGRVLPGGTILLAGDQGWSALSEDDGRSIRLLRSGESSLTDLMAHPDGTVTIASVSGLLRQDAPWLGHGRTFGAASR
jgi:photosystem II stability/assembly factor-like uncharacterized protein